MNILHHKSWHVRTKENIARVRRDEAKAAEGEAEKQRKIAVADYESRINFLRTKANGGKSSSTIISSNDEPVVESTENAHPEAAPSQHVELFGDFEDKMKKVKPMDEEKRLEQEKYEKQIGYLMYLGQDTNESLGTRNWYDVAPKRDEEQNDDRPVEVGLKVKHLHDPMLRFLKKPFGQTTSSKTVPAIAADAVSPSKSLKASDTIRLSVEKERKKKSKNKKQHKGKRKRKNCSSDSGASDTEDEIKRHKFDNLRMLREKRLQREKAEQDRAKLFLMEKFPALAPPPDLGKREKSATPLERPVPFVKQKYNSQFNPVLAKQNYN